MLEQKDLQAIAQLIDERAKQTEVYLFGEMDKLKKRLKVLEEKMAIA